MAEDTKAALMDAAKQLVVERGYAGASIRELTAASGTNLGAVNYHFGSRENLLNQAILEAVLEYFVDWASRVGEQGPADPDAEPLAHLAARARPLVEGIAEARPWFVMALEAILQAQRSPELREQLAAHYAEHRRRIVESITASSSRGRELPERFLENLASYMLAVIDGLQLQALLDPEAIPTGDELALMYEAFAAAAKAAGS